MKSAIRNQIFLIILLLASTTGHAAALLDQAEQLIRHGKSEQAYAMLLEVFEGQAGNIDYDYLFGLAALDSGHPTEAVFAFERILDTYPDHAEARIELARAYYELNEYNAAKQEFENVRDKVPPAVQSTIDKFLAAIRHASAPAQRHFEAFIQAGAGFDTNVNGATDSPNIILTGLGNIPVTLNDSGLEKESPVASFDAGIYLEEPASEDTSIYARGFVTAYDPIDEGEFSTEIIGGSLGFLSFIEDDQFRVGVTGLRYFVDEKKNFDEGGLELSWQHSVDKNSQVSVSAKYSAIRYPDQEARNVNQASARIGYVRAFERKGNPVIFASLSGGNEDEKDSSRADLGRDYYGISAGFLYTLRSNITGLAGLGYQHSRYGAKNPFFGTTRQDHLYSASTGLIVDLNKDWAVRPSLKYTRNDSTLPINDYSRWQAHVNLRRTF